MCIGVRVVFNRIVFIYNAVMRVSPEMRPDRDRYVQSKGHSVEALYVVLADRGFGDQALYELSKDQLGFDLVVRLRGADLAERRYREELADGLTPQVAYERRWAATLLGRAQTRLAEGIQSLGAAEQLPVHARNVLLERQLSPTDGGDEKAARTHRNQLTSRGAHGSRLARYLSWCGRP